VSKDRSKRHENPTNFPGRQDKRYGTQTVNWEPTTFCHVCMIALAAEHQTCMV